MSESSARSGAIAETIGRVRRIVTEQGVNRDALGAVKSELIALAARRELFPEADFPPTSAGGQRLYTLSIDPDKRFALYLDCSDEGHETPPHNHTTWAVIAGVRGAELNRLYRPTPDEGGERGPLEQTGEIRVEPGSGVAFLPDDFHSIHVEAGRTNMSLHLYGLGLGELKDRVKYDFQTGEYAWFAPHPDAR